MTSLSLPAARRRFLFMLWLSAALHAIVVGFTRLPPPVTVSLPPELEVQLAKPVQLVQPGKPLPEPKPMQLPRPVTPVPQIRPEPRPVLQPEPNLVAPTVAPAPQVAPTPLPAASAAAPTREAPGPQVSIPVMVDTRYYSAKELDVQPSSLRRPDPAYPSRADEEGVSGRVVVRLHLEADGSISKTEVVSVTPGGVFGEMFRKSTLDSMKSIRFRPAQRNGQAVRAVVEIPVVFEPNN